MQFRITRYVNACLSRKVASSSEVSANAVAYFLVELGHGNSYVEAVNAFRFSDDCVVYSYFSLAMPIFHSSARPLSRQLI